MDIVHSLSKVALLGSAWVLWLLLIISAVSLAVAAERWWVMNRNRQRMDRISGPLLRALRVGDLEAASLALGDNASVQAGVLRLALERTGDGPDAVLDAIEGEFGRARKQLDRGMNLLGTVGSNAPFLGLFGTVIGVIEAFHHLTLGNADAMGMVMAGISEALVATAVGIFVALPAVVAYNALGKLVQDVADDVGSLGKLLTASLHARHAEPGSVRLHAVDSEPAGKRSGKSPANGGR